MRIITLAMLMSIALTGTAEEYWSVGSFGSEENGTAESRRIASETGMDVQVNLNDGAALYRLLVMKTADAAAQKSVIESAGISPWTYHMDNDAGTNIPQRDDAADDQPISSSRSFFMVLASFRKQAPAEDMADALESSFDGVFVSASVVVGETYYRVVQGPHASKSEMAKNQAADQGYADAWWITEYVEEEVVEEEVVEVIVEVSDASADAQENLNEASPDVMTATKPVVLAAEIEPPQPGQTFFSYCVQQANQLERAIYCADTSFNELVVAERRVVDRETALLEFCAIRANAIERTKYCGD